MTQTDQIKLCKAGFMIIRTRDIPESGDHRIMYKEKSITEWRTYEKDFKSKAARDRRVKELLEDPKIIME